MGIGIYPVGMNPISLSNIHFARQLAAVSGIRLPPYFIQVSNNTSKIKLYRNGLRVNFINISYTNQGGIYTQTQRVPAFDIKISEMPLLRPLSSVDLTISLFPKETDLTRIFLLDIFG